MSGHGNLWVGSLPLGLDEQSFVEMFKGFGTVLSHKLVADRRYGFVKYSQGMEAEAAIASLNGAEVGGSNIVVKLADNDRGAGGGKGGCAGAAGGFGKAGQAFSAPSFGGGSCGGGGADGGPCDNLYIKGLPAGMTEENVTDTFSHYGTVTSCKVLNNSGVTRDGSGMTVAFVRFGDVEEAKWVVENLHGNIFEGLTEPLTVKFANKGGGKGGGKAGCGGAGLYGITPGGCMPGGCAGAQAWNGGAGAGASAGGFAGGGGQGQHLVPGLPFKITNGGDFSNLYVKNLPPTADDLYLFRVFSPFGCVFSVKAVQKEMFSFGFVKYRSNEEAQNAIDNLNGLTLTDGVTLHVSVKTEGKQA